MIPPCYMDSLVKGVMVIIPQELPRSNKSPFGWDFFQKRLSNENASKSSEKNEEIVSLFFSLKILMKS